MAVPQSKTLACGALLPLIQVTITLVDRETGATVVPIALRSVIRRVTLYPEENASVQKGLGFTRVTQLSGGGITFRPMLLNARSGL